jgi:hypothetical protein
MSKSPEDRYPSAGDLGRAAQAALRGEQPALPERTVATGMAATRPAEMVASEPATAATRPIAPKRRRWALGLAATALVAVAGIAIAVSAGGGGSEPSAAAGEGSGDGPNSPKPKPAAKPKTLTRSELIAKADAICEASQSSYASVRSAALEESPDVSYAVTLAGISQRGVNRFRGLVPPPSVEPAFGKYLEAQERVMRYDRQALRAAEAGDATAYLAARRRRDDEARERYDLARRVGLQRCSASPG